MLIPSRDGGHIDDSSPLPSLPMNVEWIGIAFLDRDGVINHNRDDYVNSPASMVLFDDSGEAIGALRRAGFRICVVTNQSPIGRGLWSHARLAEINAKMRRLLLAQDEDAHIDLLLYCPHSPKDRCDCRKPKSGMLRKGFEVLNRYRGEKQNSPSTLDFMVGDREVDMTAGRDFGVRIFKADPKVGVYPLLPRLLDAGDFGD